jgi:hypothetical protein
MLGNMKCPRIQSGRTSFIDRRSKLLFHPRENSALCCATRVSAVEGCGWRPGAVSLSGSPGSSISSMVTCDCGPVSSSSGPPFFQDLNNSLNWASSLDTF